MASAVNHQTDDQGYPPFWDWDADGDDVDGTFIRAGKGHTRQGPRTFVTLNVGGEERTVWLLNQVLANIFSREAYNRPSKRIEPGERIKIKRLGKRESDISGRTYVDYRADFPDAPQLSQIELFGVPKTCPQRLSNERRLSYQSSRSPSSWKRKPMATSRSKPSNPALQSAKRALKLPKRPPTAADVPRPRAISSPKVEIHPNQLDFDGNEYGDVWHRPA
jgi:hypothetical protein